MFIIVYIKLLYLFFVYVNMDVKRLSDFIFRYEEKTNFLSYNYSANVNISINGINKDIYVSSYIIINDDDTESFEFNTNINNVFRKDFDNINSINFNTDELEKDYFSILKPTIEKNLPIKEKYYRKEYRESWIVNEVPYLKIPNGLNINIQTEDDYVNKKIKSRHSTTLHIELEYKEYKQVITKNKWGRPYSLDGKITRNKGRSYSNLQNLIEKYILLVDFDIGRTEAEKIAKIEREKIITEKFNILNDLFASEDVIIECGLRNHRKNNTLIDRYFVKINGYDFEHEISKRDDKFNFGNFYGLKEHQVKDIIDTLKKG